MRRFLPSLFRRRRVRTRALLQIEFVECGAAALGIILDYFGRRETLPRLRALCKVSRDGSGASAIMRAGRELGLCFVMLGTLALVAPSMAAAVLPKIFFDAILGEGATHWLRPALIGMAVTAAILSALTVLQQRALAKVEMNLAVRSASEFFW